MFLRRFRFEVSDTFASLFLLHSVVAEYLFALFIVLPSTEVGIFPHSVHGVLGTFIFLNILGNLLMTRLNESTIRKIILPSILKEGWHFCAACEANSPPRTFHCSKCKICVLKRDHHCTFASCCIGLKNFRYFLLFLLYLSIGATYATVFNMYFVWDYLGGFSLYAVAAHALPFVFFICGLLSVQSFLYTFMSMLSICGVLFVSNLFVLHLRQMLRNQTTFEKNHAVNNYDLGWRNNVVESLGANWHLIWIFPLIVSPLPSDGLSFKTNKEIEPVSNNLQPEGNLRQRHTLISL